MYRNIVIGGSNHILLAYRGSGSLMHNPGNKVLQQHITSRRRDYNQKEHQKDKAQIVTDIIQHVQSSSRQFLRWEDGVWVEAPSKSVRKMVRRLLSGSSDHDDASIIQQGTHHHQPTKGDDDASFTPRENDSIDAADIHRQSQSLSLSPNRRRSPRKHEFGGVETADVASTITLKKDHGDDSATSPSEPKTVRRSPRKLLANTASLPVVHDSNNNNNNNSDSGDDDDQQKQQQNQQQQPPHPTWLPLNWKHQLIPRKRTTTSDRYYYSPKCGLRFRSRPEVQKFLHCLEQVVVGGKQTKGKEEEEEEYETEQNEMDAYDLFKGSFTNEKWKKRGRSDGVGGGGSVGSRNNDGTGSSRIVGKKRRKSPRVQAKPAAAVVPDDVSSSSRTGLKKPDSIASSRPQRGTAASATGKRGGGGGSAAKQQQQQQQEEIPIGNIGYTFRKQFHQGWYTGKVVTIRPGAALNKDRRCVYEDGDEEDLSLEELKILATLDSCRRLDQQQQRKKEMTTTLLLGGGNNDTSASNNLPKPANGYEYTKMEAMKIITTFPKKCQDVSPTDPNYCDGRERGKAINTMLDKGWVPIAKKNLYKAVRRYEAGIPISTEWKNANSTRTTRGKEEDLVDNNPENQQLSRDLADKLDEYLKAQNNQRWYAMFEKLKAFKMKYGTTRVYRSTPGANEVLKNWTKKMRTLCRAYVRGDTTADQDRRIDEMRFALLQTIGFDFELPAGSSSMNGINPKRQLSRDLAGKLDEYLKETNNQRWYSMFEKLQAFKRQYGTTNIHRSASGADEVLRRWAEKMRTLCRAFVSGDNTQELKIGRIDEMRFSLLQSIGFDFELVGPSSSPSKPVKSITRKRGFVPGEVLSQGPPTSTPRMKRVRVSAAAKDPMNGSNPKTQLSRDLAGKLDEYLKPQNNQRWYLMFEKLKAFKRQYGTTNIYRSTPGADEGLKSWAKKMRSLCRAFVSGDNTQDRRTGQIDEMRFALLQSIGFDFELVGPSSSPSKPVKSITRKRGFVPGEVLSQGPPPAASTPRMKRVRVSAAAKEPMNGSNPTTQLSRDLAGKLDEYLKETNNQRWYSMFEKLKAFKRQYGTTNIYRSTPGADEGLKSWAKKMRSLCRAFVRGDNTQDRRIGQIDEMRFSLLQSIGFDFELVGPSSSPSKSAKSIARKREFVPDEELAQGPPPAASTPRMKRVRVSAAAKEPMNGSKPKTQLNRDLAGSLDEYLEATKNQRWYAMFEKLKAFKRQYGTTNIYRSTPGADEGLKSWAKEMRFHCRAFVSGDTTRERRMDEMRFALLQSIGFDFKLAGPSPSSPSKAARSIAREREFVPDKALAQGPPPAASTPRRKRVRVSATANEPSPEDPEVILLDSLNYVPLDITAESTLHSNFHAEDGGDSDESNDGHGEDNEWLHRVASLLTTEKSTTKGQKRPPSGPPSRSISSVASSSPPLPTWVTAAVPDAGTSSQFKGNVIPATQLKTNYQASSAKGNTIGKSSHCVDKKKRHLVDSFFYWICSCDTVNKFRSTECSACKEDKNSHSQRSLLLEKAEKAIESDEVQLVQEAFEYIPVVDRQAIPDKVIAYLLQQKIPGVNFSAFCRRPSNELDDYFFWLCDSCTMKNSYTIANCTACLQPKSTLADDSSLLAIAKEAAEKSKTVEEAIALIPPKERRAIPAVILDGLITCNAFIGEGRNQRRCKAARCAGFDYCVPHCDPLLIEKSRTTPQGSQEGDCSSGCSQSKPDQSARGINKINKYFPTFLSGIDDKIVNNLNWSLHCIEDGILCGESKPFPLGLKVRKFFLGHGFHDGRIVKTVRKLLVDKEAQEQRPVLVYRIVYNDGDEEDFLHHEIASLRQVFDQANISPKSSPSVQIPPGTYFELKTGNTVKVVSHKTPQVCRNSQHEGDRLVVQLDNSSKETEVDLFKFQLAVVRKLDSSNSSISPENDSHAPFLEWPRHGHGSGQPDDYDIGEGLTLSRQRYKSTNKNDTASSFTSSAIDNPRDARPGVKMRMWDPAECFNHLSYDPYAATVCEFCGVDNNENQVVICDKCHCGFHTYCLRPVMVNIPKGDWLCSACSGSSNSVTFEEYKKSINQQEMIRFLGLPFHEATRFFNIYSEAIDLFKENSKNAIKQRALSLQIPAKQATFEVGVIKFIRAPENSDWRLPVPLLTIKEWTTSLSTIVAAMKYCGMVNYSADLLYPSIGHATEEMNSPDLDVDKIHPMSKRNIEIFKAFKHNIKHGIFPPVRVVYDENMGFNVEALAPIQKYTLVGEYVGDVVTVDRSGSSNSDSLMLLLQTEDPKTSLIIDPTLSGNYSRFLSGINNRNLLSKRKANVRTRRFAMDGKIHVALFTSRDIEVGEILSYDYNAGNHGKCVEEWAKAGFYDTSNFF